MIVDFVESSPSRKAYSPYEEAARRVHSWDGEGSPLVDIHHIQPKQGLKHILPVARWIMAGGQCRKPYDLVIIDEGQDMSPLEIEACLHMVASDGAAYAFLDPGQAIFGSSKWAHAGLPPAWTIAGEQWQIQGGFRVGEPLASIAASVLKPVFDRDAAVFRKPGAVTEYLEWDGEVPARGLILGLSRSMVTNYALAHGNSPTFALTAGAGSPDTEAVFSVVHAAKGFEADEVYLLDWPITWLERIARKDPAALQILYVALTRARKAVHVAPLLKTFLDSCLPLTQ